MKHYENINRVGRKQRKEEEEKTSNACSLYSIYYSAASAVGSPLQSLFVINLGNIVVLVLWKALFKSRR